MLNVKLFSSTEGYIPNNIGFLISKFRSCIFIIKGWLVVMIDRKVEKEGRIE
jgi:hypothetical protein